MSKTTKRAKTPKSAAQADGASKQKSVTNAKGKAGAGKPKAPKPAKPKRIGALDAAAKVLTGVAKPMRAQEMIAQMEAKGLWKSPGGKTPHATLYAAIIREIADEKGKARFRKTGRGLFTAAS